MRFLLDQNQSPLLAGFLAAAGHDAVHVRDVAMATAIDRVVLAFALGEQRVASVPTLTLVSCLHGPMCQAHRSRSSGGRDSAAQAKLLRCCWPISTP